jgi:pyruvate/2-oxoglutarate dehydrogenase complex dihydrolipoamide dehydrogenase (E3) component
MARLQRFDVVVIGSGSAGFAAALAARAAKASVCLVERDALGGECPNYACIPSKALLRGAKLLRETQRAREFGVSLQHAVADFSAMQAFRAAAILRVTGGKNGERYVDLAQKAGIEILRGEAAFTDANTVEVGDAVVQARAFVLATGAEEIVPNIPGLADITFLNSREALRLPRQPKSVAIVGGGPVGVELATFFSAVGSRVLLFQRSATVLSREDGEIARLAHEQLKRHGVELFGNASVDELVNARAGIYGVKATAEGKTQMHAVEEVILAAGRRSAVSKLNLSAPGVRLAADGSIAVDERGRTSVSSIFAAGDADGGAMFTHTAHVEGTLAGHNAALAARGARTGWMTRDERVVPRVTFADPEIASVGATQGEVAEKFGSALVGRFPVAALGRAVADHVMEGLVKIVAHPKNRRVLGCHIASERAGEMIHEAALAMHLNATVDRLASMIHAYPTYSEAIAGAASAAVIE